MKKMMALFAAVFALSAMAAENLVNVSWGDSIMVGSGISKLDTPEKIEASVNIWHKVFDVQTILWRASSDVIARDYYRRSFNNNFQAQYDAKVASIEAICNPVEVAKAAAKKNGQKFYIYLTFLDHGAPETIYYADSAVFPWQDKEFIKHPEYNEVALDGTRQYGVPDLSNDDFRKMMIERLLKYVNFYKPDGLYLCSRTHSNPALHGDQFGFGPKIVAEYQKRYGIDITKDKRFDYKSPEFAPNSKEVQAWRDLRGEYLVQFLAELRQALGKTELILAIPRGKTLQAPYGNITVDKKTIIERKLVDGMVTGVYVGKFLYPKRTAKHKTLGYLESDEEYYNVPTYEQEAAILKSYAKNSKDFKVYCSQRSLGAPTFKNSDGSMFNAPACQPTPVIKDKGNLYSNSFTVEGFFYVARNQGHFSTNPRLISRYSHAANEARGWEVFCLEKGKLRFRTNIVNAQGSAIDHTLDSNSPMIYDEWVHIACVFDDVKKEKRMYINGKLDASAKFDPAYSLRNNNGTDLVIASYAHTNDARVKIDELRLTDNAEFNGVPTKPYSGKEAGTVFLFHFDKAMEKVTTPKGVEVIYVATPELTDGVFGKAIDLTRVD
ncbi:MAG: LamG domain-containing protein [Lentisphaeria bacterium]|nr:LamG domain-containing protein [Lentisphaeria bacterium]